MRTLRLARVAAEAEGLLLRRRLRRIVIRAMLGGVAGVFLLGTLAMLHVYVWLRLRQSWPPETAALILAGCDLVVAAVIALFALWTPTDRIAAEAVMVRDKAMIEMRSAFSVASLLRPLGGLLFEQWLLRRGRKKP